MKKLALLPLGLLLTACVSGYNPFYYFNEVQVVNQTGDRIADVSVRIIDSKKALACDEVNNFAMCDDRFGKRRYPQQGIELSWTHPDGERKSETFNPSVPAFFGSASPLRIVVEIKEDGSVNPFYEQDEPGRDGIFMSGLKLNL